MRRFKLYFSASQCPGFVTFFVEDEGPEPPRGLIEHLGRSLGLHYCWSEDVTEEHA